MCECLMTIGKLSAENESDFGDYRNEARGSLLEERLA